jgi:hypothetical protein
MEENKNSHYENESMRVWLLAVHVKLQPGMSFHACVGIYVCMYTHIHIHDVYTYVYRVCLYICLYICISCM